MPVRESVPGWVPEFLKPIMKTSSLLVVLFPLLGGCLGPKIATDLLAKVERQETPLSPAAAVVQVTINPDINNSEELDASVRESLEIALANANVLGTDSARPCRIAANIAIASQSAFSFGSFEGKLEIHYVVHDPEGKQLLDEKIHTVAGSDTSYFLGAARHRRARACNISKNVLEFVDLLVKRLKQEP